MDDEITAMFQVAKILEGLDEETRARVVRWAADKFGVDLGQAIDDEDVESTDETMLGGIDPEKVAAAKAARASGDDSAPKLQVKPASSLEPEEAPPERDPDKPSFLDTSFRMFSGKQELKKKKEENN
jgi:hypothetical protein